MNSLVTLAFFVCVASWFGFFCETHKNYAKHRNIIKTVNSVYFIYLCVFYNILCMDVTVGFHSFHSNDHNNNIYTTSKTIYHIIMDNNNNNNKI